MTFNSITFNRTSRLLSSDTFSVPCTTSTLNKNPSVNVIFRRSLKRAATLTYKKNKKLNLIRLQISYVIMIYDQHCVHKNIVQKPETEKTLLIFQLSIMTFSAPASIVQSSNFIPVAILCLLLPRSINIFLSYLISFARTGASWYVM